MKAIKINVIPKTHLKSSIPLEIDQQNFKIKWIITTKFCFQRFSWLNPAMRYKYFRQTMTLIIIQKKNNLMSIRRIFKLICKVMKNKTTLLTIGNIIILEDQWSGNFGGKMEQSMIYKTTRMFHCRLSQLLLMQRKMFSLRWAAAQTT